jgi:hypothetical protein
MPGPRLRAGSTVAPPANRSKRQCAAGTDRNAVGAPRRESTASSRNGPPRTCCRAPARRCSGVRAADGDASARIFDGTSRGHRRRIGDVPRRETLADSIRVLRFRRRATGKRRRSRDRRLAAWRRLRRRLPSGPAGYRAPLREILAWPVTSLEAPPQDRCAMRGLRGSSPLLRQPRRG